MCPGRLLPLLLQLWVPPLSLLLQEDPVQLTRAVTQLLQGGPGQGGASDREGGNASAGANEGGRGTLCCVAGSKWVRWVMGG